MRVFAEIASYDRSARRGLNDITKSLWNDRSPEERRKVYGRRVDWFVHVDRIEDADLVLLTNKWNHYVDRDQVSLAETEVRAARRAGKPVVAFCGGDFTAHVPWPDVWVFECSTYRSRSRGRTHAMPPFFHDTATEYYGGEPPLMPLEELPSVGFCGQAGGPTTQIFGRHLRLLLRKAAWRIGKLRWEPPPFEHTLLRKRVLDTFIRSADVEARFILRSHYRAGLPQVDTGKANRAQSEREFVENIIGTAYTICVRGGGNYSKRFYEALCLGRIPVLIDTDSALPFEGIVDWNRFCVRVDAGALHEAPARVRAFHRQHDTDSFAQLQRDCRQLWLDRLTVDGFYGNFLDHFGQLRRTSA